MKKENNDSVTIAKPNTPPHTSVARRKLESYLLKKQCLCLSLSFHFREQFPPPQEIKTNKNFKTLHSYQRRSNKNCCQVRIVLKKNKTKQRYKYKTVENRYLEVKSKQLR